MSFSESRVMICSEVKAFRYRDGVLEPPCLRRGANDIAQAGVLLKRVFAGLELRARLSAAKKPLPMNAQRLLSITPSRCKISANVVIPARAEC